MTAKAQPNTLYSLRKTPVQSRAKATVDAVLEAAAQLLIAQGYDRTSTNQIAERAGVSIGSLYEYFPGKEAIFAEIRRRLSLDHYARLTTEPRPTTPKSMLRHLVTSHIGYIRANLNLHVALSTEVPRFAIAETESAILEDFVPQSNAFLELHRSKLRPSADVPFITEFLMRVLSSTINDYALRSPDRLQDPMLVEEVIDLLGRYLLRRP